MSQGKIENILNRTKKKIQCIKICDTAKAVTWDKSVTLNVYIRKKGFKSIILASTLRNNEVTLNPKQKE